MTSETFLRVRNLPEVKVNKGPGCRCGCSPRYFLMAVTGHVDVLSVAKAGSGLVVQQHLVVRYKACTSYMQLLLPYYHNTSTANY